MKHTFSKLRSVLLAAAATITVAASAEDVAVTFVKMETSSSTKNYVMYEAGKMYFANSSLVVDQKGDGNIEATNLEKINKLMFSTGTISGVGEITITEAAPSLNAVPTMVKESFVIESTADGEFTYLMIDAKGQTKSQGTATSGSSIDISNFEAGVYLLKVNNSIVKIVKL